MMMQRLSLDGWRRWSKPPMRIPKPARSAERLFSRMAGCSTPALSYGGIAAPSPPWVGRAPAPTAFDRLRPVDFCGSSSLLVRATAWDTVGGLDERFYPAYYVDTDLCMALRQHRFIVLYQPASRIRHHQSASTTPRFREFLFQHNRQLFLEKWGATSGGRGAAGKKLAGGNRAGPRTRRSFCGVMSQRGHRGDRSAPKAGAV